ncbi:MAG TPA: class I SAM-dependent methyltransferase [Gaiellaceae bacterium]|nr:class I SAM-dependent methyltransferase [Gaiellaceae bacterium]
MIDRLRQWWLDRETDRMARKPSGRRARAVYGAPDVHSFAWAPVLDALRLDADDVLLDVGCGGGAFLRHALELVPRAVGVDHSRAMVRLARRTNADLVRAGRVRIVHGKVGALPFAEAEFTAVSCLVAFLFFADPVLALREIRRVLDRERGRVAIFTVPPELEGTLAAPEPVASRAHFYGDGELDQLALAAGFVEARTTRGEQGAQLLVARG